VVVQTLEKQLQARLHLAGCVRRGNPPESRVTRIGGRVHQVHVVERIEHLPTELHGRAFFDASILEQGKIPTHQSGSANDAISGIAVGARQRVQKRGCIEPSLDFALVGRKIPVLDPVGPVTSTVSPGYWIQVS
jgi:hypothetical protein